MDAGCTCLLCAGIGDVSLFVAVLVWSDSSTEIAASEANFEMAARRTVEERLNSGPPTVGLADLQASRSFNGVNHVIKLTIIVTC